jgi:hypothetical protein
MVELNYMVFSIFLRVLSKTIAFFLRQTRISIKHMVKFLYLFLVGLNYMFFIAENHVIEY